MSKTIELGLVGFTDKGAWQEGYTSTVDGTTYTGYDANDIVHTDRGVYKGNADGNTANPDTDTEGKWDKWADIASATTAATEAAVAEALANVDTTLTEVKTATTAANSAAASAQTAATSADKATAAANEAAAAAALVGENVNAELSDTNQLTVTNASGESKTVDLAEAAEVGDIKASAERSSLALGHYSDRDDITLVATETGKAISSDGVKVSKSGWAIAEFTAEKGNEYLFKPGVTDGTVCVFAEYIDKVEDRAIDYTYTYNEDGTIATATATYGGKTHKYTYTYDAGGTATITDADGNTVSALPLLYTTTVGTYSPLVRLNADAELPTDGYCRFMSHFQGNNSLKVVVSYKVGSADLTMKVLRDGVFASISTQLGNLSQKQSDTANAVSKLTDSYLELISEREEVLVADGVEITIPANKLTRVYCKTDCYWKFIGHAAWGWTKTNPLTYLDVSHIDWSGMATTDYYSDKYYLMGLVQRAGRLTTLDMGGMDKLMLPWLLSHGTATTYHTDEVVYPTSGYVPPRSGFQAHTVRRVVFHGGTWDVKGQWNTPLLENDPFSGKKIVFDATQGNKNFSFCFGLISGDIDFSQAVTTGATHIGLTGEKMTGIDVTGFDTSAVTSLYRTFFCNYAMKKITGIGAWDTSAVTNMQLMFSGCSALTTLDVSAWDTSAVTNMQQMFSGCSALTTLDVSAWDTSAVTNMQQMFSGCSALTTLDVSAWDTSAVTNMQLMFSGCSALTTLDVSAWDTSAVTNMQQMFSGCSALTTLIGSHTLAEVEAGTVVAFKGCKTALSLGNSPKLDRKSLLAVIKGLADITGSTSLQLGLGTTLKAKLTADDIKIATDKGWVVA